MRWMRGRMMGWRSGWSSTMGVGILAGCLALGQGRLNAQAPTPPAYFEILQGDHEYDCLITDLFQWAGDNFFGGSGGTIDNINLTLLDLDGDGVEEWILDNDYWRGQNQTYAVFRREPNGFYYTGQIYGSPPEVVYSKVGSQQIRSWGHIGGGEGYESICSLQGRKLVDFAGTHWKTNDEGDLVAVEE